jgi:hypothetical protein
MVKPARSSAQSTAGNSVSPDGRLHGDHGFEMAAARLLEEPRLTERMLERAREIDERIVPVARAAVGELAEATGVGALLRW